MRKVLLLLAFAMSASWGGFFIDSEVAKAEPVRELPTWFFGGSFEVGFYLNSLDVGANVAGEYRIHKHHSVALSAGMLFGGELLEVGADWRFYFSGSLMETGYDDFIRVGLYGVYFDKYDESYFPPAITVGLGRDFMPLSKADFLCRLEVRLAYVMGESVPEKSENSFINRETNLLTHFDIGIFLF